MAERRWTFVVQDARGRRHRGIVTWSDHLDDRPPSPTPAAFRIALVSHAGALPEPPVRTAICVPGAPRLRAIRSGEDVQLPRRIADLTLPPHKMAEYASGRIVMASEGLIEPVDVFPPHSDHPRLDRLALALVEAAEVEATAPYTAVIRHELGLPPGADALAALGERLAPADVNARPPSRAPAVLRLARALRRLRDGLSPNDGLDQVTEDLRFLRLFDMREPVLKHDALDRLFDDVRNATPARGPAKIVRLRPRRKRR